MTIIAAFPYGKKDRSALRLAATISRSQGEDIRILSVVPEPGRASIPNASDYQFAAWSRERRRRAKSEAERAAAEVCPDLATTVVTVANRSRARGILAEAAASKASMIVLGSGTEGIRGRIRVSATSDRLLHSSPVPVALAPKGYGASLGRIDSTDDGEVEALRITRVTCSFRGDEETQNVLAATARIARASRAGLRVATFGVGGRTVEPACLDDGTARGAYVDQLRAAQLKAIEGLDGSQGVDGTVESEIAEAVGVGRDWKTALQALAWEPGEVLVIGSSSEGRRSRVFLGTNAARIIRHSAVPVLVIP